MPLRRIIPAVIALGAVTAACGASGDGGLGDAVEVVASAPARASAQACDLERQTVQLAADAYFAIAGSLPTTEQELIDEGLLREPSELFDVNADGELVPAPAGPCT